MLTIVVACNMPAYFVKMPFFVSLTIALRIVDVIKRGNMVRREKKGLIVYVLFIFFDYSGILVFI